MPPEVDSNTPAVRRGPDGKFLPGTAPGPGSGVPRRVARARSILLDSVLADGGALMREVVECLGDIIRDPRQKAQDRIAATKALTEMVLGRNGEGLDTLVMLEEVESKLTAVSGPAHADIADAMRRGLPSAEPEA